MRSHTLATVALCIWLSGCVASPPANLATARLQVIGAETAFAKTMADRDHDAFATFVAEDAVFFAGKNPIRGKARVVASWAALYDAPNAPFSWQPEEVEILDSGSLAFSSGPVRDPAGNVIGQFNSIWRHRGAGVWEVIFDKGSDACNCAAQ